MYILLMKCPIHYIYISISEYLFVITFYCYILNLFIYCTSSFPVIVYFIFYISLNLKRVEFAEKIILDGMRVTNWPDKKWGKNHRKTDK